MTLGYTVRLFGLLGLGIYIPVCAADYPQFPQEQLRTGRTVWLDNCMTCHGYGVADAPMPTDAQAWRPRLEKPKSTLYEHALNGFFGPDDTLMPARGGNAALSDAEVRAAVDYMVEFARQTIRQQPQQDEAKR
jgi:cytochrome c5